MSTIAEDIVLITHTDAGSGVFTQPDELTEVLVGGCLLAEALLAGVLALADGRRFSAGSHSLTAEVDPLVERAVHHAREVVASSEAETDDQLWLAEVTYPISAAHEVVDRLRARGALTKEERKRFGRRAETVEVADPAALGAIHDRMRAVMLDGQTPSPDTSLLCLTTAAVGVYVDLDRSERKRWNERSEALYTAFFWQGDEGTPIEPTPGVDDSTRRMIGDFVVSLGTAYQLGIGQEILAALNRFRRGPT